MTTKKEKPENDGRRVGPPPFPGEEAFREAERRFQEWKRSPEGRKFFPEDFPEEDAEKK